MAGENGYHAEPGGPTGSGDNRTAAEDSVNGFTLSGG